MSKDYKLKFDLTSFQELDNFALLAVQKYNLGDKGDWFNHFRGGKGGLFARVTGVQIHYYKVHSWNLEMIPVPVEYHLSSILFNMDSAIECMVFSLNALGYIADSEQFHDVTDVWKLRSINPNNILGKPPKYDEGFVRGYDAYFPNLKKYWQKNLDLIKKIAEHHDVSKHRTTIYKGGKINSNPPPGFFKKLGIENDEVMQMLCSPMEEIILIRQPKTPWKQRKKNYSPHPLLETIAEEFCTFINTCGEKALKDAKRNIKLKYNKFIST